MGYVADLALLDGQLAAYFAEHKHGRNWDRAAIAEQQAAIGRLYALASTGDQMAAQAAAAQAAPVMEAPALQPAAPCAGCEEKKAAPPGRVTITPKGKENGPEPEQTGQSDSGTAGQAQPGA